MNAIRVKRLPFLFFLVFGLNGALFTGCVSMGKNLPGILRHRKAVYTVAYSPDGKQIASGSADKTIKIWDAETGGLIRTLSGHEGAVRSIAYSSNGAAIVSGSEDQTIRLWYTDNEWPILTLSVEHEEDPVSFSGSKYIYRYTTKLGSVESVAISPDDRFIISGSGAILAADDRYPAPPQPRINSGNNKYDIGSYIESQPRFSYIVSGYEGVRLWDSGNGRQLGRTVFDHEYGVNVVAFSPDGSRFLSGSTDETIKIWDPTKASDNNFWQLPVTLSGHTDAVLCAVFSPDGNLIVSGSADKSLRTWDTQTGKGLKTITRHKGSVLSVALSPDGKRLASASKDKTIIVWDMEAGRELFAITGHKNDVNSVAFSPDGKRLVSGSSDKTVRVWNVENGQEVLFK
jgi:WD40 repeat protein